MCMLSRRRNVSADGGKWNTTKIAPSGSAWCITTVRPVLFANVTDVSATADPDASTGHTLSIVVVDEIGDGSVEA